MCSLCLVQGAIQNKESARGPLLHYSSGGVATIMLLAAICVPNHHGYGLQLRQTNFESFSKGPMSLRSDVDYDEAKDIIGAQCFVRDDEKKEWFV